MKRLLLAAIATTLAVNGFAQGAIDVGNNVGATTFRAPIFGPEPGSPGTSISGQPNTTPAFPVGSTVYTGPRLAGTGFTFGFYASTTGITADRNALTLIGTLPFGTAGAAGFATPALTTMNVPGVIAGNTTTFQIRVWDNVGGTVTSFANATTRGESVLVNSAPLGGIGPGGPITNPQSVGWISFNIYVVPEPSTFVLAGVAAASLLIFRRRK